jgi:hypothetical protein
MRRVCVLAATMLGVGLVFGGGGAAADSSSGPSGLTVVDPGSVSASADMSVPALAPSPDPNGDVTCNGLAPASVRHDLIVPAGDNCPVLSGTTIGHDLIVDQGAGLLTGGITVGHDVTGQDPAHIQIGNPTFPGALHSSIGHDVNVTGATDSRFVAVQLVCDATIAHDLTWQNDAANTHLYVGDLDFPCSAGADHVGHDVTVKNNQGLNDVSDNKPANNGAGFGHDLTVQDNTSMTVESNAIGHDCNQQNNHPYTNNDGDSTGPNTAGHNIDACNTPNP